jgi:hypothetical protein
MLLHFKILFHVNSQVNKVIRKTKESQLVHHSECCCADGRWTAVKVNDSAGWSGDGVMF